MNYLAPSILSADFNILGKEVAALDAANVEYIHLDVMDGQFVHNISFGVPVISSIRKSTSKVFDVHLMINDPVRYIGDFVEAGADIITFHVEACADVIGTINEIRKYGIRAGITLNPDTPVSAIEPYMDKVDMVMVMSVNPGFGGQKFTAEALDRIKEVRKCRNEKKLSFDIEVDGGVTMENLSSILEAGANVIVAGSAIFEGDIEENVRRFKAVMCKW